MTLHFSNTWIKEKGVTILLSFIFLNFALNDSGALAQSQGAKGVNSKSSAVTKPIKSPSGSQSIKKPSKKLPAKTQSPSKKSPPAPKNLKSDTKLPPSSAKLPTPSAKPLKVDPKPPANKPSGLGAKPGAETTKKAKAEKPSKSKHKIENNQDGELSFDEGESEGSTIWVWLIPVGFFAAAGGLYLFQRFQHLLVHQTKESKPEKDVRPESRAEVAFGSVLASLDLDIARGEDSGSKASEKLADKRGKAKNFQESLQNSARRDHHEDDKTKASGPKQKPIDQENQVHHATLVSDKTKPLQPPEAVAVSATLEPETSFALAPEETSSTVSPGATANQGSSFLTAPPSAMNWVNPFLDDQNPKNELNIKLKQASGYQNAVKNSANKDKK